MAPCIALIGFMLESNAFAPVADEAEFRQKHWIEGEDIVVDARAPVPRDPGGFVGFCGAMDETGPWLPVPLAMTSAGASGPVEQGFFDGFVRLVEERLRAALPSRAYTSRRMAPTAAPSTSIPRASCLPPCAQSSGRRSPSWRRSTCTPTSRAGWSRRPISSSPT
jgi:hypothetical protein